MKAMFDSNFYGEKRKQDCLSEKINDIYEKIEAISNEKNINVEELSKKFKSSTKINIFYDFSEIDNELNCLNCKDRFDVPKNVPCGGVLCGTCCNSYTNPKSNEFNCPVCDKLHAIPENGTFPTNKLILNLLNKKPIEVYRGKLIEDFKLKLYDIKYKIKEIEKKSFNGTQKITEHCDNLKIEVDQATELLIEKIKDKQKEMIMKIESFKKECIENYESNNKKAEYETKLNSIITVSQRFFVEWKDYLSKSQIEETSIVNAIVNSNLLTNKLKKLNSILDKMIFNKTSIQFEKQTEFDSNILGTIDIKSFENDEDDEDDEEDMEQDLNAYYESINYICSQCKKPIKEPSSKLPSKSRKKIESSDEEECGMPVKCRPHK
jgi:hypothetical protein